MVKKGNNNVATYQYLRVSTAKQSEVRQENEIEKKGIQN